MAMQAFHWNLFRVGICLLATGALAAPEPTSSPAGALSMSPELRQLYLAEMHGLLGGVEATAVAIPAGDWAAVARTAKAMQDSYVLEKKLTKAQELELGSLPDGFRALDASFHLRAGKLSDAALARDAELVSFQFSRLLET